MKKTFWLVLLMLLITSQAFAGVVIWKENFNSPTAPASVGLNVTLNTTVSATEGNKWLYTRGTAPATMKILASGGNQYLNVGDGTMYNNRIFSTQSIALSQNTNYRLTWDQKMSVVPDGGLDNYVWLMSSIDGNGGGVTISTLPPYPDNEKNFASSAYDIWETKSYSFATGDDDDALFMRLKLMGNLSLDNFVLQDMTQAPAVPEPGTLLGLLTMVPVGLAFLRKKA